MSDAFQSVRDFEQALCEYTGAPYAVAVTSCTEALMLAVAWHLREPKVKIGIDLHRDGVTHLGLETTEHLRNGRAECPPIEIPKRTYVGVANSIIHAGGWPTFRDEEWTGAYQLKPLPVWDCARIFTSGMYSHQEDALKRGMMQCVSFHWAKTLALGQGGAILHDSYEADYWLKRARFDGRQEGIEPRNQTQDAWIVGFHCYMSPGTASEGIKRLAHLPRHNKPIPNDLYPDLSEFKIFK